ncbi:MAG: hypothetical protein Q7Q71_11110 [Verrucomicrobiota bacterium JB023]|nr:hypothetical protein [Verrucomicrobiota bacterium JB023]
MERNDTPASVPKTWELPPAIRARLGVAAGRQRLMDAEGHLLLILHAVPQPEDEESRQGVFFWQAADGQWKSAPERGGLKALQAHLGSYRKAIHGVDALTDKATRPEDYFEALQRAHPLLRSTRNLLSVLQSAREARRLDPSLIALRDEAVDLERAIDLTTQDAKVGMDFSLAKSAQEQAAFAHQAAAEARRLNLLAAFFFPLATLVAIFGMNSPRDVLADGSLVGVIVVGVMIGFIVLLAVMGGKRGAGR